MATFRKVLHLQTQHEGDIIDLTGELKKALGESSLKSGLACVFVPHSTAAIFAMEFEPGLRKDMREALHRLMPKGHRVRASQDLERRERALPCPLVVPGARP